MKKIFGTSSKSKSKGISSEDPTPPATPAAISHTPIHAAHAVYQQQRTQLVALRPNSVVDNDYDQSAEDLAMAYEPPPSINASRTSSFASLQGTLPPGASPPNPIQPNPNNSPSLPPSNPPATLRKRPPQRDNSVGSVTASAPQAALSVAGKLMALDSTTNQAYLPHHHHTHSSSDLHHSMFPPSGRDTPISMSTVQQQYFDDSQQPLLHQKDKEKEKASKWNLFARHDDGRDREKERRKDDKVLLSARDQEIRMIDREKKEERDRQHWHFVDREETTNTNINTRRDQPVENKKKDNISGDRETGELIRMIGYLTATASEDWALVLEVCERASANEANAKEAVKALRREFKYGPPAAQLAAARLWAIMLRNSSDIFIAQCTQRKFLDTLEDLITNTGGPFNTGKGTSPVVRERVMDVLAAAAFASGRESPFCF
ncbi:hypothetical protein D9757_003341 [Collybiopsis confluens]|uniref:VHS domain-containing protein n=1 Tax=Collybiopsis confluens TaxID=2823264 RepID=A0A8H5HYY1_9AGAR|nr:hypothetical protein D9757_003341 [Collybiopsis confluens]